MSRIREGWRRPEHAPLLWGCDRSPSPLGLLVVQRRAQLVEQSAAMAISGVGRIEKEMRRVREMVEATTAEAKSVRGEVESRIATLAVVADVSAAHATGNISRDAS